MEDVESAPKSNAADSPSDYMAALKMHVDIANSERQAIWARHATMLVGNSLIVSAARFGEGSNTQFLNVAGFLLCVVWAVMTYYGWGWFYKSLLDGKAIPVSAPFNPFAGYQNISRRRTDSIFICAMLVVLIFASIYLIGLWPSIRALGSYVCGRS